MDNSGKPMALSFIPHNQPLEDINHESAAAESGWQMPITQGDAADFLSRKLS